MNSYSFTLSRHMEERNKIYFISYLVLSTTLQVYNYIHFTKEEIDTHGGKYAQDVVASKWQSQNFNPCL